jgi:hypothetical protein
MNGSLSVSEVHPKKHLTSALQHHKRDMDPTKKLDLRTMNGLPSILMGLATSRKP